MRLIGTILSALVMATAAWGAGPDDGPDKATQVRAAESVVQVVPTGCSGDEGNRSGSGFAIGDDGYFVTDLHVVAGCTQYSVRAPNKPPGEWPATLVGILKERDLALLKVDPPPGIPGLEPAIAPAQFNEKLEVIGFPLGLPFPINAPLNVTLLAAEANPQLNYTLDDPSRTELMQIGYPATDTDIVQVLGSLDPGDSGAPLIDWQGHVAAIGDGGLERGTVGIGWATQPQYIKELENSNEPLNIASLGAATVDFAYTTPKTAAQQADAQVKCGALDLVRSRDMTAGELIKTTDDPVKLGKLMRLVGSPAAHFVNDEFTIWTEPISGAGIALPKGLRIVGGSDYCTVHTAVPNIDYVIALTRLTFDANSAEWEVAANRQGWLAGHLVLAAAGTRQLRPDPKYTVSPRFENGGIVRRVMWTGQGTDREPVRVFTNDLAGRGAYVSVAVLNRGAKADPSQVTAPEQAAWARGLLAVNLTALPPLAKDAAVAQSASEAAEMVWPGPRTYPRIRCGDAALIPAAQPRPLVDLPGSADLDSVLRPIVGIDTAAIAKDLFDLWIQPAKGAVVLLPHGLAPTANEQACRLAAAQSPISYVLRVGKGRKNLLPWEWRRQAAATTQAFVQDLTRRTGGSFRPDPAAQFQAQVYPNGHVSGQLLLGVGGDGRRTLVYWVSLLRDKVLTLFAVTDADMKDPEVLAPADRAALAQALAAVRLSTVLPPTGYLTAAAEPGAAPTPAAAQTANH